MNIRVSSLILSVAVLIAVVLSGCGSSRNAVEYDSIYDEQSVTSEHRHDKSEKPVQKPQTEKQPSRVEEHHRQTETTSRQHATATAEAVIKAAREMLGTPYRYGRTGRGGTDCSGLTSLAYEKGAGIKLPRSSREQAQYCRRIEREELCPGDLVFFTSRSGGGSINHVAIYIGDNKIIHATTSQGVVITGLDDYYWRSHYYCGGRVL